MLFCWFIIGIKKSSNQCCSLQSTRPSLPTKTGEAIYWKWDNTPRPRRVTGKVCLLFPRITAEFSRSSASVLNGQCGTHRWSGCWALCPEAPVMWAVLSESCSWVCCQWEKLDSGSFLALFRPASLHRCGGLGSSLRKDLQWDTGKQSLMLWDMLGESVVTGEKNKIKINIVKC